jgi:hypothetical protein
VYLIVRETAVRCFFFAAVLSPVCCCVQVRKAWMKANLLVHPDKVRQRNGGDEQVAIADMIFDALKEAWGQFRN